MEEGAKNSYNDFGEVVTEDLNEHAFFCADDAMLLPGKQDEFQ